MNSFALRAVGNLGRNPELVTKDDTSYTRICLIGSDYAGKNPDGTAREVTTSLWLVAFNSLGEAIAKHARVGDQLCVEAKIQSNNWVDDRGQKQYEHSYIITGFKFGAPGRAKREEMARDEMASGS